VQATGVLSAITSLKKLCNHPKLIYDTLHSKAQVSSAVTAVQRCIFVVSVAYSKTRFGCCSVLLLFTVVSESCFSLLLYQS
jgi:SNF2 family DNA or RNA helicase